MAKNVAIRALRRVPKWLGEQVMWIQALAEQLGLKGTVTTALVAVLGATWVWLRSHIPLWLTVALFFFLAACGAILFRNIVVARSVMRFDPTRIKELGEDLYGLGKAILDFSHDNSLPRFGGGARGAEDMQAQWERGIEEQNRIYSRFLSQFGPRIQAKYILLQRLGVPIHFHARVGHFYSIPTVGLFLGTVGDLLKAGLLEEARLVSNTDVFYMR